MVFLYPKDRKEEVRSMTMVKREPNNIWSRVREDRDIDDLIFGEESYYGYMEDHTCSERLRTVPALQFWTYRHRGSFLPG